MTNKELVFAALLALNAITGCVVHSKQGRELDAIRLELKMLKHAMPETSLE